MFTENRVGLPYFPRSELFSEFAFALHLSSIIIYFPRSKSCCFPLSEFSHYLPNYIWTATRKSGGGFRFLLVFISKYAPTSTTSLQHEFDRRREFQFVWRVLGGGISHAAYSRVVHCGNVLKGVRRRLHRAVVYRAVGDRGGGCALQFVLACECPSRCR